MCIAILNSGKKISFKKFKASLESNPDGFGIAYIDSGQIKTFKSLSLDVKNLYKKYGMYFNKFSQKPMLVHFRIGTGSNIDLFNCHPFMVNNNLAMIHNGIIRSLGNKKESDTVQFTRLLSSFEQKDIFYSESLRALISYRIGSSKLVFLNSLGHYSIINEKLGHWAEDGNWYSNYSYIEYRPTVNSKKQTVYSDWVEDYEPANKKQTCEACLIASDKLTKVYDMKVCEDCVEQYRLHELWG
jgi:predicted glutamine amidotransferase